MSVKRPIVHLNNRTTPKKETNKMNNPQKEVQTKLTKGLLDLIVLQFLETEPMHGYQLITTIRKRFGVYLGPSTIYPLLGTLEKKGHIKSEWNMDNERPRKVYSLTNDGKTVLAFTNNSLTMICRGMKTEVKSELDVHIALFGNEQPPKRINNFQVKAK
jgi:DNA-binding PadR family transcriptional regulator